ncbi:hypothetical protein DH2020_030678 [Rehmannia glutinosa]|uniref:Nucleotide-diphospho-sugar transferase domain-containing protein n=1 Tax=Rehmannia glutinosa TaxID=99300 RepID=A0ABR0VMK4_REHGL
MYVHGDKLGEALATASTMSKTVIITIVNKAYVEGDKPMLDLFLDGFWIGEGTRDLVDHLLIVAMDQTSYERCRFLRLNCYKLETEGVDFVGEKDTDVLWLRNPFPYLSPNHTLDLQISTDKFKGNKWAESNPINTGFYMIRSNNRTVSLFDTWYAKKDNSTGLKEQDVLNKLMHQGFFRKLGIRVRFLDTVHFSGFCQDSRNVTAVATVHANCCRRIAAKLADLTRVVHDWRRYKNSSSVDGRTTTSFRWTNHTACKNSWRD